jgi:hypothetical protein
LPGILATLAKQGDEVGKGAQDECHADVEDPGSRELGIEDVRDVTGISMKEREDVQTQR